MTDWTATDALVFDMDGTLWDAVDSYCRIWNVAFRRYGYDVTVSRECLIGCMGMQLEAIYDRITGGMLELEVPEFLAFVEAEEARLMPTLGGCPYPGVCEGIRRLSADYKIFLLSNCGETGLDNMMRHTGITDYVCEAVTYGATRRSKSENLLMLKEKYSLKQPVYVGDTQSDCDQTHRAGMPFVFASYGFGSCGDSDLSVESFEDLVEYFVKQKQ